MANGPGIGGIVARTVAALVLVFATYNPERASYFHWAIAPLRTGEPTGGPASLKFLAGLALLGGWAIFLSATRRSIGLGGALLVIAISGGLVWLLIDVGVVSATSARGISYVVLICTALLLAVGMSWSHLSRKLTGQVDMDPSE